MFQSKEFIECINDCYLSQAITEPTRVESSNTLDLLLTNTLNSINDINVGETLSNSDHNIIRFRYNFAYRSKPKDNLMTVPDYKKGNYDKMRIKLNSINWGEIFNCKDAHEMWEIFINIINELKIECIPQKIKRKLTKHKPLWFNRNIQTKLKDKKKKYNKYKSSGREIDLISYKQCRNETSNLIRKSKREKEIRLANDKNKNPKKFFSYFKYNNKFKNSVGPLETETGKFLTEDKDIANALNNHFSYVFNSNSTQTNSNNIETSSEFYEISFSIDDIYKLITSLGENKSVGPDNIHIKMLKEGKNSFAIALDYIFRRSLTFAEIPEDWKHANITPIFKKGKKSDVNNYRPISLTSVVCKILERIIKRNLVDYIESNSLLNNSQHGFRKNKSCLTNLLEYIDYVSGELDRGNSVNVIYLDFSKAFDKISHNKLLCKLAYFGIGGNMLSWIREWLTSRKQRVVLNGYKSQWKNVLSGVPQGSVLGPLLFILFINDIDNGISSRLFKFADDCKVAKSIHNLEDNIKLQHDLDLLEGWADKWEMTFNTNKCSSLSFGDKDEFSYSLNGNWLADKNNEKDLGVIIDTKLKFHEQCISARNKANRALGFIHRNVTYKSKHVVISLYNSYVRPHLEYCIQAWRPHYRHDIHLLESVQRRATKMISGFKNKPYHERLKELDLYPMEYRQLRGDLIETYKILNNIDNISTNDFLRLRQNNITRGHSMMLEKPRCRLDVFKYSFAVRVVNEWNALPEYVVTSCNVETFKRSLDNHLKSRIHEFIP